MDEGLVLLAIRLLVRISGNDALIMNGLHEIKGQGIDQDANLKIFDRRHEPLIMNALQRLMAVLNKIGYTNQPSYNHC
jgi:hypothetical protein